MEFIPFVRNKCEFGKEAAQIFCLERVTIAEWQGTSEDEKFVAKPTQQNSHLFLTNGISPKRKSYQRALYQTLSCVSVMLMLLSTSGFAEDSALDDELNDSFSEELTAANSWFSKSSGLPAGVPQAAREPSSSNTSNKSKQSRKQCQAQGEPIECGIPPAYNAPAALDVNPNGGGASTFVEGSFTYWYAGEEGLNLAQTAGIELASTTYGLFDLFSKMVSTSSAVAGEVFPLTSNTVVLQSSNYKPGFKVRAGVITSREWVVYAQYTWYRGTHTTSRTVSLLPLQDLLALPVAQGSPILIPNDWFPLQGALIGSKVSSKWKLALDLIDACISRPFYQGKRVIVSPFGGLRAALIRQTVIIQLDQSALIAAGDISDTTTPFQPVGSRNYSHSWGIGPRAGVDVQLLVGRGFRFEGDVAASLLYTRYTTLKHREDSDDIEQALGPYSMTFPSYSCLRPIAELGLGIGWGTYLANQEYHLDFSADYEFMFFWAQNMIRKLLDDTFTSTSAAAGSLYLHGLTFTSRFDF